MPFISKIDKEAKEVKSASQTREEYKEEQEIKNLLYGAGKEGWTEEYYNKILECSKNNLLVVCGVRPHKTQEGKYQYPTGSEKFKDILSNVYLLLAENKKEKDLTLQEKLFLMVNCHPLTIIKMNREQLTTDNVITAFKWHQLTDFKHIDELKAQYPDIYNRWVEKNMIPLNVISNLVKKENNLGGNE